MPGFLLGWLAAAGVIAAAGPFLIHLLNRQRYRVVEWAAMDFLREAMRRSRRILHLRDLLLLCLRTLCLLLIGLALARPQWGSGAAALSGSQPVHAVVVIDNSLSMGFRTFDKTLLDEAKARAIEFIERLPAGSQISVLPLCGSVNAFSRDAYRSVQDARDALQLIETVDRPANSAQAIDLAIEACEAVKDLPAKRVVVIGDQQKINWPAGVLQSRAKSLPDLQLAQVAVENPENAWVEDLKLEDGLADVETPATITAVLRYRGAAPRLAVPVTLQVDDTVVATRTVDLEPGQRREVEFTHHFNDAVEPGEVRFTPVSVSLQADKLPADDVRVLSAPVVAALPVLFIDQLGSGENRQQGRYGETFPLRRLLVPVTDRADLNRQLVQIRHITQDELTLESLRDARLAVIAGIERPTEATVSLLRDYVDQGGQLIVAAGGDFDPASWNDLAWKEGRGILPLPLDREPLGKLPEESTGRLEPLQLSAESLVHDDFVIGEASREELADLYSLPVFFKAAGVQTSEQILKELLDADTERARVQQQLQSAVEQTAGEAPQPGETAEKGAAEKPPVGEAKRPEMSVAAAGRWLRWAPPPLPGAERETPDAVARRSQPRVLATFANKRPYLVERRAGQGSVLFVASGIQSSWNTVARTQAVFLYDKLLRSRLSRSLPERTLGTLAGYSFAINPADRRAEFLLERPGKLQENLSVDALGGERFGLTLRQLTQRGQYRLLAKQPLTGESLWETILSVNGPAAESDLQPLDTSELSERLGDATTYRWVGAGQQIRVSGADASSGNFWAVLLSLGLLGLVAEMVILWRTSQLTGVIGAATAVRPASGSGAPGLSAEQGALLSAQSSAQSGESLASAGGRR